MPMERGSGKRFLDKGDKASGDGFGCSGRKHLRKDGGCMERQASKADLNFSKKGCSTTSVSSSMRPSVRNNSARPSIWR